MRECKMRILILFSIVLCISFSSACNNSRQVTEKQNSEGHQSIKIDDSQERTFYSKIYNQDISLQVYLPMGYDEKDTSLKKYPPLYKEPRKSYPVLYLLDSDVYFGMAAATARLLQWENKLPGVIIVGVNYGLSNWWEKRGQDYFPSADGTSKYLEMCEKELIPYVDSNFRTDAKQRILFGHSAGGVFTFYSLFSNPGLFDGYISASLWMKYNPKSYFDLVEKYSSIENKIPAKLYLSMGALEQQEDQPEWQRLINTLQNKNYHNLLIKNIVLEDEGHLSSAPIALVKGLEWYFAKD